MSKIPAAKTTPDAVKERFGWLQPTIYALLHDFILWNDLGRYPDLPADLPGISNREKFRRNQINEFQLRNLAYSKEVSLILHLWILLYDKGEKSDFNLQDLGKQLNDPRIFPKRTQSKITIECLKFVRRNEFEKRFNTHRNKFLAHLASLQATPQDIVKHDYIYRLVPKTIYLAELLQGELLSPPAYFDNQFTVFSREVAPHFSHSKPDELLVDLFSKRSLPTSEFEVEADQFLKNFHQREKDAR